MEKLSSIYFMCSMKTAEHNIVRLAIFLTDKAKMAIDFLG